MGLRLRVSPGAFLTAALGLLLLPGRWWMGAVFAAAIHELAHLLLLWVLGGQVLGLCIGPLGIQMETLPMEPAKEAVCAVAGPMGSFLTAFLCFRFPEAALCAFAQGLYNLLPIFPLDGGRVIRVIAPESICVGLEIFTLILLLGIGFWFALTYEMGFLPMIPGCTASMQVIRRKIPCKEAKQAVQ